ncbi:MAG: hypothetical protein FJ086_14940 [Deltaproteobacteria bacterium]|nr:hypothetical protein [Deltaproteobacteria bacterium]
MALSSCGAEGLQAPAPERARADLGQCKRFEELVPAFQRAAQGGRLETLAEVIRTRLASPGPRGEPPAVSDVLRAVFKTLNDFASQPPEAGAPPGELCIPSDPAAALKADAGLPLPAESQPLCEVRRATDALLHAGQGREALQLVEPQLVGVLNYVVGRDRKDPSRLVTPHYEVAGVLSGMCQQSAVCRMEDTLDLVAAFVAWLKTPEGAASLGRLDTLLKNPALAPFLTGEGTTYGGENGVVALVDVILPLVQGMQGPADLDALPLDVLPEGLRADAEAGVADLKLLLDPQRTPSVLRPLKKALTCYVAQDGSRDVVRMVYRLALEEKLPEFGLTRLLGVVKGLRTVDGRGTLLHLAGTLVDAIRADEEAVDASARVCHALFRTVPDPGQVKSNAALALPAIRELFTDGILTESLCALDAFVYGCAGGSAPGCNTVAE